jgi:ABC-type sugar transport system substrate-binding protein
MSLKTLLGAVALGAIALSATARAEEIAVGGIVFQQDMYFRGIQLGLEAGAKENKATLLQGNSESKPEKEASFVNTFVSRGVKAIVIAPISAKASVKALQAAHDKGVKVVLYGTHLDADFPVTFIGTSDADIGKGSGEVAATFFKDKLGGNDKANVALLGFRSQLPEQSDARTNGFLDQVKGVKIVAQQDAWLAEKAVAVASDILTAHPEVNVIYAANEGGTVGAVQAVRRAGKQGKVFVFGTDGSEQLANMLLDPDNVLVATTAQQPFEVGRKAMAAALDSVAGKPVEKAVMVPVLPLSRGDKAGVDAFLADAKKMK